jgi:hypothetical protein
LPASHFDALLGGLGLQSEATSLSTFVSMSVQLAIWKPQSPAAFAFSHALVNLALHFVILVASGAVFVA